MVIGDGYFTEVGFGYQVASDAFSRLRRYAPCCKMNVFSSEGKSDMASGHYGRLGRRKQPPASWAIDREKTGKYS